MRARPIQLPPREQLLAKMPRKSICAEIGVHEGGFSQEILWSVNPVRLHLIDPWEYSKGEEYEQAWYGGKASAGQATLESRFRSVKTRFRTEIARQQVVLHRCYSAEAASVFSDGYFDWIYIDGNHLYEYVKRDLELYHSKVKLGGYITGDDYGVKGWWSNGVQKAVDEFVALRTGLSLIVLGNQFIIRKESLGNEIQHSSPCKIRSYVGEKEPKILIGLPMTERPRQSYLRASKLHLPISAHRLMKYALITPAHNEAAFIEKTLASMVAQTLLPLRWVIVDDGSTDQTAEIVERYAVRCPWIDLVRRPERSDRSFAGKVNAFNAGLERVRSLEFDVIGNLDADLSFEPDYLEFLMLKFSEHPKLGVAGTPFTEDGGYDTAKDSFEGENHVAGGCQLFRHQCFEDIGGYIANPAGGIDWIAVTTARMKGWKTQSFPEKRFHHYRTLGTAGKSNWEASFSYGEKDYYLGGSPLWQFFRVAYRTTKQPVEGLGLLAGYCWAAIWRTKRAVTPQLMHFHRREQMKKLRAIFGRLLRFKKLDSFRVAMERQ